MVASRNDRLAQLSYEPFTDPQIAFQPTLAASGEAAAQPARFPPVAQLPDDGDVDEPPASLLVELGPPSPRSSAKRPVHAPSPSPPLLPEYAAPAIHPDGPPWEPFGPGEATAERIQLPRWLPRAWSTSHQHLGPLRRPTAPRPSLKERVLRQWRDYANQDAFFERVYAYYVGKGIAAIFLSRLLNWLVLGFVVGFSVFLGGCIDYNQIHTAPSLAAVVVPYCWRQFSLPAQALMAIAVACYGLQLVHLVFELGQLRELHCFYTQALGITHQELQTCSWNEVVRQLVELRDQDLLAMKRRTEQTLGSKASRTAHARRLKALRLNTHDIANRIMRRDNYLIALFNRDVLNLAVPFTTWLPFGGERSALGTPAISTLLYPDLTKVLEWNLLFCLTGPVFDRQGHVHRKVLRESYRAELTTALRRRFMFMGWVNLVCFPFMAVFLLLHFFYRYFDEIYRNPGSAASRQYTAYARWKFRDFNELPHLFHARLNQSYPKAVEYLAQFPQEVVHLLARFASFIAGSFAAVLFLLTMWDYELSLEFEVTPGKTVLFYISVFGAIATASRAMLPAAFQPRDPAQALQQVLDHLHYLPTDWRGRLHTPRVRAQFEQLFDYKLRIYARELCSVITTPFVLWFSLAPGADRLVDFFREFTVHVDGIGYVCSFAVFDFKRHGNAQYGAPGYPGNGHLVSREGKLEQSVVNFKLNHPEWTPSDPLASVYLQRVQDAFHQQQRSQLLKQRDWMVQSGLFAGAPDAGARRRGKQPEREEPGGESASVVQSPGMSEVNSTEASHLLYLSAMANVSHQPHPPTAGVLSLVNQPSEWRQVVPVAGLLPNPSTPRPTTK
ncbi:autophagy protein atg9 [Dimargaris xerosporica]|nr:autophagy protein atg9 [Dimargaris xerosporica]